MSAMSSSSSLVDRRENPSAQQLLDTAALLVHHDEVWPSALAEMLRIDRRSKEFETILQCMRFGDSQLRLETDSLVCAEISARLAARRSDAPIQIAEMGFGTTWPTPSKNLTGAPWLSRSLARLASRGLVECVACDLADDGWLAPTTDSAWVADLASIVPGRGGMYGIRILSRNWVPRELVEQLIIEISAGRLDGDTDGRLSPIRYEPHMRSGFARDLVTWLRLDPDCRQHIYLRPRVDVEVERRLFGLPVVGDVDITKPIDRLPSATFDLIFARMQIPAFSPAPPAGLPNIFGRILENLKPLLREGGAILFGLDPKYPSWASGRLHVELPPNWLVR